MKTKALLAACLLLQITLATGVLPVCAITNGQDAIDEVGQLDLSDQPNWTRSGGPDNRGLTAPYAVAVDTVGHNLFVAESVGDIARVVAYPLSSSNTVTTRVASHVLGQPDLEASGTSVTQSGLTAPQSLMYDPSHRRLFVGDVTRVLVYDVSTITDGMSATYVLGQPDFTTSTSATTQSGFTAPSVLPRGLAYDSVHQKLFVSDPLNYRVLVFDLTSGISNGMAAANVLGQAVFTSSANVVSQSGLGQPAGLTFDPVNGRLFVAETTNNRVTVFGTNTISDGMPAANVLGQSTFTASSSAGCTQSGLSSPYALDYDTAAARLFVADTLHARVLTFDVTSISNGEAATKVLGQSVFTTCTSGSNVGQSSTTWPSGVAYIANNAQLWVADKNSARAAMFKVGTITNGMAASDEMGELVSLTDQPLWTKSGGNLPNVRRMTGANDVAIDTSTHRLFVADATRVLVYNLDSNNGFTSHLPDNVLGAANFDTTRTTTQSGLTHVNGLVYDVARRKLFVSDGTSSVGNRILVFNVATITDGMAAANVLGQTTFTGSAGATTQSQMKFPQGMAYDAAHTRLYVADQGNRRVLVFNVSSITNGMAAANVLGKADFITSTLSTTQSGMGTAWGLAYDSINQRLFATDIHRILVFNVSSITNGMAAVNVLGQSNFTSSSQVSPPTQASLSPGGLSYDSNNTRLFVANPSDTRVTIFDVSSISDGMNATNVLGEPDFVTNSSAVTQNGFGSSRGVVYDGTHSKLFVADGGAARTMTFDVSTTTLRNQSQMFFGD